MYFNNGFKTTYEELLSFYPSFYREVFEMRAILEAEGRITDRVINEINQVIDNSFVATADENMITRLERFLGLQSDKSKSIEERRQIVGFCILGFGKLSASKLKENINAVSGSECGVELLPSDEVGNNRLEVRIPNPQKDFDPEAIVTLLNRRLPAHIWYRVNVAHQHNSAFSVGFALHIKKTVEIGCDIAQIYPDVLTDENGDTLINENGEYLII